MKTADRKELHTKSKTELKKLLKEAREAFLAAQLDNRQSKLKNTRSIFIERKKIAVIKTILNEKEEK